MQLASIPVLSQPPLAAMPQLSEKPHQGFATKKTAWNPGPNVCNFTVTLGLQVVVSENGVRKTYSARYYNPQTGRFLSRDPEAGKPVAPSTLHKYLYAGGDPINKIDPRGREELLEYAFMAYHLTIEGIDFGHDEKGCLVDAFVGLATGIGSATDGSTTANEGLNIAMALGGCSDEADYNLALGFIWSKVFPFSGAD